MPKKSNIISCTGFIRACDYRVSCRRKSLQEIEVDLDRFKSWLKENEHFAGKDAMVSVEEVQHIDVLRVKFERHPPIRKGQSKFLKLDFPTMVPRKKLTIRSLEYWRDFLQDAMEKEVLVIVRMIDNQIIEVVHA